MMRRESPPEKNVYFRAKNVDDREKIAKIEKKFPKTIPGPTQMLCVNFSSIGSAVSEKLEIISFSDFKKNVNCLNFYFFLLSYRPFSTFFARK